MMMSSLNQLTVLQHLGARILALIHASLHSYDGRQSSSHFDKVKNVLILTSEKNTCTQYREHLPTYCHIHVNFPIETEAKLPHKCEVSTHR